MQDENKQLKETINEAVEILGKYKHYSTPTEEQNSENEDVVDSLEKNKIDLENIIKQAKSKILDLAIHGKLVPQDPNDESAEELLKRIATSDNRPYKKLDDEGPFDIPESWAWCKLGEICDYGKCINVNSSDLKADLLTEISFGELEGSFSDDFLNTDTPRKYFFTEPQKYVPPKGGETFDQICQRTKKFVQTVIEPKFQENPDLLQHLWL